MKSLYALALIACLPGAALAGGGDTFSTTAPVVQECVFTFDDMFGRMFVAGRNPVLIRREQIGDFIVLLTAQTGWVVAPTTRAFLADDPDGTIVAFEQNGCLAEPRISKDLITYDAAY
jgi:hypothetical protein